MIRRLLSTALLLSLLLLLLGFAGRFHGAGDTLAVLRPVLALFAALLSVILFATRLRLLGAIGLAGASLSVLTMLPLAPASAVTDGVRHYSAYQKNLLFRLPDTAPVAADILKSGADFVTLQELHQRNRPILKELGAQYPYQHFCPFAAVGGIAVLSRWPSIDGQTLCGDGSGLAAMQVMTPDGPLWVVSLHLHWPYPYRQPKQIQSLLPLISTLKEPVLVGGDFNMVPWSYAVEEISQVTHGQLPGYVAGTFSLSYQRNDRNLAAWLPRLPIDHVLIPKTAQALSVQERDRLGSDHNGVLALFVMGAGS